MVFKWPVWIVNSQRVVQIFFEQNNSNYITLILAVGFHLSGVSPPSMSQAFLSWLVSEFRFSKFRSFSIVFLHVRGGSTLPFFFFSRFITVLVIYSWLRCSACPKHLSLFTRIFSAIGAILNDPLICSLCILSSLHPQSNTIWVLKF